MIFTRIAWVVGLLLVATMCWMAVAGFKPVIPLLVTGIVLAVLIGGGNVISGRSSPYGGRRRPAPGERDGPASGGSA